MKNDVTEHFLRDNLRENQITLQEENKIKAQHIHQISREENTQMRQFYDRQRENQTRRM